MLVRPQSATCVESKPLRIAVAIAPDFTPRPWKRNKRVILWNRTVGANANDLACIIGELLSAFRLPTSTNRGGEVAIIRERNPTTQLFSARRRGAFEDDPLVYQRVARLVELCPQHADRGEFLVTMGI